MTHMEETVTAVAPPDQHMEHFHCNTELVFLDPGESVLSTTVQAISLELF